MIPSGILCVELWASWLGMGMGSGLRVFVSASLLGFLKKKYLLFLAVLGLSCCAGAFSRHSKQGLLSSCSIQASHCGGVSCHGARALGCAGFSNCGSWAQLPRGMWNLPQLGMEPGFPTTGARGKSRRISLSP